MIFSGDAPVDAPNVTMTASQTTVTEGEDSLILNCEVISIIIISVRDVVGISRLMPIRPPPLNG